MDVESQQTAGDVRTAVNGLIEKQRARGLGGRLNLISVLEAIQETYGYLPENALQVLAEETGESINRLYGLASFYTSFSFEPKGRHVISVCLGTACHVRRSPELVEEFSAALGIEPGQTTADGEHTLETVNCVGACALGPVAVINGTYYPKLKRTKVKGVLKGLKKEGGEVDLDQDPRVFPVQVACPHCGQSLMDAEHEIDGHPSARFTISRGGETGELFLSGLWGSRHSQFDCDVPEGAIVEFSCPACGTPLTASTLCPQCDAPLVALILVEGGAASICSRRGCGEHLLDLEGTTLDALMMRKDER